MGSWQYLKRARREPRAGKVEALLDAKLKGVEWGEFRIGDLFEKIKTKKLHYKANDLPKQITGKHTLPCLTSSFQNQGLNYFVPREGATILKNVISIPSNSDIYRAYFQANEFTVLSDAYAIRWIFNNLTLSNNQSLFVVQSINKITDLPIYSYKNKLGGWNIVKNKYIQLPTKNNEIDFEFMENFIAELEAKKIARLEAYLVENGLKEYRLSQEEEEVLRDFESGNIEWGEFKYKNIFDKIKQGRRLKKDDHIQGDIPFVMAGTTNTGVANYISNPIASFPKNSITIDIFGNTFYRSYGFGAGDDTGVYWSSENKYSKEEMLFFTVSMAKSVLGKFDYGTKLRSSQSVNFEMKLPTKNNQPDYALMQTLISAVQKMVVKDVVLYVEGKRS